jgi:hypothetical protein
MSFIASEMVIKHCLSRLHMHSLDTAIDSHGIAHHSSQHDNGRREQKLVLERISEANEVGFVRALIAPSTCNHECAFSCTLLHSSLSSSVS